MINESPHPEPRRRTRLTRRGRLVLMASTLAAATAVAVPLLGETPADTKTLLIPEGWRASQVYTAVDQALDLPEGTTREAATADGTALRLPDAAKGNPEGFLFPATYPFAADTTPQDLLGYMARTAGKRFGTDRITAGAQRHGLSTYETVTIASIVQAEADTAEDMGKVARVVHNRLARDMPLQMDSTINYALGRSTLDTTHQDTRTDSPYNTYARKGLPPTPIDNPGEQAMKAAVTPTPGDWLYFVTVKPGDTRFTASYEEQRRNVEEFNRHRKGA
ncbi:endolytic transglycosylase MltG [Streptomyces sp. NPDC001941]|uniref:endolytic transglycosylase MltG n=1 Tax=Streptomyces sp. NPDC001941 TaxID=3154659 RepID=UPI00332B3C1F